MKVPTMNSYLIPNKAFLNLKNQDDDEGDNIGIFRLMYHQNIEERDQVLRIEEGLTYREPATTQREKDLDNLISDLEVDLKKKMESNWKLLFSIDEVSKERNFFYNLLLQIEVSRKLNNLRCQKIMQEHDDSEIKDTINEYLSFVPDEFKTPDDEGEIDEN